MSKTKSTWPDELFGETFFGRRSNFISFNGFSEENLICKKFQCSSVRHSSCPVEQSKGQISGRNKTFLFLGSEQECFRFLAKQIWQSCQNCIPCDQSNLWSKLNFFPKETALLILLPTFNEKFQYSLKTDPPALSSPQPSFPQKLQKKNWTNQAGVLRVRWSGRLRGKILAVTNFFDLRAMSEKMMVCWRKVFSGTVNTAFHMFCREKLSEKRVFFLRK